MKLLVNKFVLCLEEQDVEMKTTGKILENKPIENINHNHSSNYDFYGIC